jgi:CheY-like chemotaxis protein
MAPLKRLLVVENEAKDLKLAAETARSMGIPEVEARTSLESAKTFLEKGLTGERPLPDGILLDLDLGYESGYELLRFWHSTPRLSEIPMIVWSVLGPEHREMCNLFKIKTFVGKWEGAAALREALSRVEQAGSQEATSH